MRKSPSYDVVLVEWVDSSSQGGLWKDPIDLSKTAKTCFSVGWIIRKDKKVLQIASSAAMDNRDSFDQVAGDMTIPRSCVVRIKTISRGRR